MQLNGSRFTFIYAFIFYGCFGLGVPWFEGEAVHIVELQYSDDAAATIIATMRKWLASGKAQPTIRYSLLGTATILRVDFELESEARVFAQAFGGTVLP